MADKESGEAKLSKYERTRLLKSANQRRYIANLSQEKLEEKRRKDRERYTRLKAEKKIKLVKDMTEKEKVKARKLWKKKQADYREKKKSEEQLFLVPPLASYSDDEAEFSDSTQKVADRNNQRKGRVKRCLLRFSLDLAEKELVEFLNEEIAAEKKLQKSKNIPSELCGFKVKLDGSEVTLVKTSGDETIEINFNVNHSVDTDEEPEINQNMDKPEVELKSKPTFEVDIKRGNKTLGFTCSYISHNQDHAEDDSYTDDIFGIDEVTFYEGEWKDCNYAVSGEVLDGYLYDLLMNLLEEKGITNELMEKVSNFATAFEHSSYIEMLESMQKFAAGK